MASLRPWLIRESGGDVNRRELLESRKGSQQAAHSPLRIRWGEAQPLSLHLSILSQWSDAFLRTVSTAGAGASLGPSTGRAHRQGSRGPR